ncbi:MAG: AmmeMemoRadiSam system radical SAM enzyme [Candidatus Marinimicrobia bacterium]|nr:AmmeMemoRadiSam system radical SAM enzyme [Candidatus Neomarinimicrobiota bacterium]
MPLSRRNFLKLIGCSTLASCTLGASVFNSDKPYIREAKYYNKLNNNIVECLLCPNKCLLREGVRGDCRVRINQNGQLKTLVYGRLCSLNNDPIEKKPLYHFLPGEKAISIATPGCNLRCKFCQNHSISQTRPEDISTKYISSEKLISTANQYNSPIIAYTYSEPTIFYEYMYDTARIESDLKHVMISAGFIEEKPLKELCQVLDGIKIDLKSFSDKFYRDLVSGRLDPILRTLKTIHESNTWLEIVYLVIPTHNDNMDEIKQMCDWILKNLGPDVPLHFTRFHSSYLMKNLPPTPLKTLNNAYRVAREAGLHYVYIGNVPDHKGANTFCPQCGKELITRRGFLVGGNQLKDGKCPECGTEIAGVWH